ncbi:MAG: hypothetical protein AB7P04_07215 [Bacteriovoracia bacterium]
MVYRLPLSALVLLFLSRFAIADPVIVLNEPRCVKFGATFPESAEYTARLGKAEPNQHGSSRCAKIVHLAEAAAALAREQPRAIQVLHLPPGKASDLYRDLEPMGTLTLDLTILKLSYGVDGQRTSLRDLQEFAHLFTLDEQPSFGTVDTSFLSHPRELSEIRGKVLPSSAIVNAVIPLTGQAAEKIRPVVFSSEREGQNLGGFQFTTNQTVVVLGQYAIYLKTISWMNND